MEYRILPCHLHDGEVAKKADELAAAIAERAKIDADRKNSVEDFKEKLKGFDGKISSLAHAVRHHREDRSVPCKWERDDGRLSMILVRTDTFEIVDTRPMREDEKQATLFEVGGQRRKATAGEGDGGAPTS